MPNEANKLIVTLLQCSEKDSAKFVSSRFTLNIRLQFSEYLKKKPTYLYLRIDAAWAEAAPELYVNRRLFEFLLSITIISNRHKEDLFVY